ncbi:MAG: hypothetical protein RLZZ528_2322 [Pseudomonadota bacterium]|jgi:putative hemolysin
MKDGTRIIASADPAPAVEQKPYDMRRLSYAGTFKNPFKANAIRAIEWTTGKLHLLKLIRQYERSGVPFGQPFWPKAMKTMGIEVLTPEDQVARIPKTGPVVVVANHPHGLVDGMVMAELIGRVRTDYKILTRSLLTGIPEIAEFLIPVPFPHEDNARELGLEMRAQCMAHLKDGGVIVLFPAGKVAHSETWFGEAIEGEWNPFTHKMVTRSGATVLPIYFPGHNTRIYQIANRVSATWRQGLLLHEIKCALNKPQAPVIGHPLSQDELNAKKLGPTELLAWLRGHTLALRG